MSSSETLPRIPLNDLGRMPDMERAAIEEAVHRVIESGWYVLGPEHDAFEHELAAYVGVPHAVGVANGTDALELALGALGVGPGDHVLTVANAGAYTTTATRMLGATPVYADVDPATLLLRAAELRAALDRLDSAGMAPKVLVVTHLYGQLADMPPLLEIARPRGIRVLEDCAQVIGAVGADGAKAGAYGDAATLSFYRRRTWAVSATAAPSSRGMRTSRRLCADADSTAGWRSTASATIADATPGSTRCRPQSSVHDSDCSTSRTLGAARSTPFTRQLQLQWSRARGARTSATLRSGRGTIARGSSPPSLPPESRRTCTTRSPTTARRSRIPPARSSCP